MNDGDSVKIVMNGKHAKINFDHSKFCPDDLFVFSDNVYARDYVFFANLKYDNNLSTGTAQSSDSDPSHVNFVSDDL